MKYISKPFITYQNKTVTYKDFELKVNELKVKFNNFIDIDDFVLINEKNPIKFYVLLFALWEANKKVVFPNKGFFEGDIVEFVKYIICEDRIIQNDNYKHIELPDYCNTVLFSSGSTGKPKGIVHNKETFIANAKAVLKSLNNISSIVSVTPLNPYLVSALSHLLVHMLSSSHLIFVDIETIPDIQNISKNNEYLSYVGSPMHIVLMLPYVSNSNPTLFFSSGDIFYHSVIKDIMGKFPLTLVYNVYGMAELGGRFFINKIDNNTDSDQYKRLGKNVNGTQIKIDEKEILVKSNLLFYGYIKDNVFLERKEDFFKTGDKVIMVDDHYEFFGRCNDEIKVAGNKVSMKYLEQKISLVMPDTYTPIVIYEEHHFLGNILILVLYNKDNLCLEREKIIKRLRSNLKVYEIPHKIYYTSELTYTQTMKIDRKQLVFNLNEMQPLQ